MRRLRDRQNIFDVAEHLGGPADGHWLSTIVVGVIVAVCMAAYGLVCMVSQQAVFFGSRPIAVIHYRGTAAVCLGVAFLSAALFLHCHFTLSWQDRWHFAAQIGKLVALTGLVIAFGYFLFDFVAFG